MKKLILLLLFIPLIFSCSSVEKEKEIIDPLFYLDPNGVTIKAYLDAKIGSEQEFNGTIYTVVDRALLKSLCSAGSNPCRVVTTFVTDLSDINTIAAGVNISTWDVSNVKTMRRMIFSSESIIDLSNWDVSNVQDMSNMLGFVDENRYFNNKSIGNWDVSNVTNMKGIFYGSSFFNQDLTKWCVKNIITEPENFCKYSSIIEANKPKWGTCPSD